MKMKGYTAIKNHATTKESHENYYEVLLINEEFEYMYTYTHRYNNHSNSRVLSISVFKYLYIYTQKW